MGRQVTKWGAVEQLEQEPLDEKRIVYGYNLGRIGTVHFVVGWACLLIAS